MYATKHILNSDFWFSHYTGHIQLICVMLAFPITLIVIGLIVIISPDIIGYIIGTIMILIGALILAFWFRYKPKRPQTVNFGRYQVSFRDTFHDK